MLGLCFWRFSCVVSFSTTGLRMDGWRNFPPSFAFAFAWERRKEGRKEGGWLRSSPLNDGEEWSKAGRETERERDLLPPSLCCSSTQDHAEQSGGKKSEKERPTGDRGFIDGFRERERERERENERDEGRWVGTQLKLRTVYIWTHTHMDGWRWLYIHTYTR